MKLTLEQLKKEGVCYKQEALFVRLFGNEVNVTQTACVLYAHRFDWGWAGVHLLNMTRFRQFHQEHKKAYAAYENSPHLDYKDRWDVYQRTRARAFARAYNLKVSRE